LQGATLRQDLDTNQAMYRSRLENRAIVTKPIKAPRAANRLLSLLNRYSRKES